MLNWLKKRIQLLTAKPLTQIDESLIEENPVDEAINASSETPLLVDEPSHSPAEESQIAKPLHNLTLADLIPVPGMKKVNGKWETDYSSWSQDDFEDDKYYRRR